MHELGCTSLGDVPLRALCSMHVYSGLAGCVAAARATESKVALAHCSVVAVIVVVAALGVV